MEKARLFLKGESISNLTKYNFANRVNDKIESGVPVCILINIIKDTEQTASDLNDLVVSKLVGVRRVFQDIRATSPKVVVEVELSSDDYIRLMKAIGNGYSLTGYSSELKMRVSSLNKNDVYCIDHRQSVSAQPVNYTDKHTEDNTIQEQNKTRESKLKHTGYNNQGFLLSLEKCNLKIIVDKQALEPIINASKSDDTSLKFDILITGKNKRARPLRIVLDSQHAYYQGVAIGIYSITGGFLNGYLDIILDNNDNTHLLFTAIQMRCEVNPCNYNSRCIHFDTLNNRVLFKDLSGNIALFKSTKISIVSRKKDKLTEMSKGYKKDGLHAICSEDHKDANKETEDKESAFSFKKHTQEDTLKEFELKISIPIMDLKHNTLTNNSEKENYLAIIEVMDASFKCPIVDLSVYKSISDSIEKTMATVSISAKALRAIEMYGLSLKGKAGVVVGRIIKKNTGNYAGHIYIPSQEDFLYYKIRKSLKDFDGDTINVSAANMPLHNPAVKTIKIESEIKNAKQEQSFKQKEIYVIEMIPIATFVDIKDAHDVCNAIREDKIVTNKDLIYKENNELRGRCRDVFVVQNANGTLTVKVAIEFKKIIADKHRSLINKIKQTHIEATKRKHSKADTTKAPVNDSDAKYKSILYQEVKFERLKDARKYANAINQGIADRLKSSNEISNLPMLTIDDFKDFKAYVEKATVGTSHHEGFKDNMAYSVVLCIYVPNEVIKKLKENNISLEDIIQYALENIQICKKGKLKNITMATPGFPIEVYFNKINQHLGNNNSIWTQKDGDTVKIYIVLYTYVKNTKIKALVIEKE